MQDEVTSTEEKIHVDVIDGSAIRTCKGEKNIDVLWPETAPGTQSVQECPVGYTGTVRRSCVMQETDNPSWQVSDYSMCTADRLKLVETDVSRQEN